MHIFEFVTNADDSDTTDCVREGSERSHSPLYDYHGSSTEEVAVHILHVFVFASQIIPATYHATTSVQLAATAGMRLLTETQQEEVYDALYQGLLQHADFKFQSMQRNDLFTLSGGLEGFYGAVA